MGGPPFQGCFSDGRGLRAARVILVAFLLVVAAVAFAPPASAASRPGPSAFLLPHGPIDVEGNAGFNATNGVTGGSGTAADPYVISGWEIDGPGLFGVQVKNTDAHAVLRDVRVAAATVAAFYFFNTRNVALQNVTSYAGLEAGIRFESSDGVSVAGSNLTFNGEGLVLEGSSNATVSSSTFTGNQGDGVVVSGSSAVTLADNDLVDNGFVGGHGVELSGSTNVTLTRNRFVGDGIHLDGTAANHFDSHTITPDNSVGGLPVLYERRCADLVVANVSLGQLLVANCQHVRVSRANVSGVGFGVAVEMAYVSEVDLGPDLQVADAGTGIEIATASSLRIEESGVIDTGTGIALRDTTDARIQGNKISSPYYAVGPGDGVSIVSSDRVNVSGNLVRHHRNGVEADQSGNVSVVGNVLDLNIMGFGAYLSRDLLALGNHFGQDGTGLRFLNVTNATVARNAFLLAYVAGANISGSSGVRVHGNTFSGNHPNAYDDTPGRDSWNATYPAGGNYWSDYAGPDLCSGPAQNVCTGADGIGDAPYTFPVGAADGYPLLAPPVTIDSPPEALFFVSPFVGNPRTVFTVNASVSSDFEEPASALRVRWSWDDDGIWDTPWSTTKAASHVYSASGVHTIRLEVLDSAGLTDNWTAQVYVAPKPDNLPPSITQTSPPAVEVGTAISIVANVTDESGLGNLTLFYRGTGDAGFRALTMGYVNGTDYEAVIPAQTTPGTVEYYIEANDSWGNTARAPLSGYATVIVNPPPPSLIPALLAAAGLTVILAVLLLRRRRGRRTSPSPPGEPSQAAPGEKGPPPGNP